ncbi:MAG: serine/threonine protein kinase [Deltaproteobacteria bacterium]|nr:serine/threonine protein kinase [Deltaproteobacteria bacterium]
MFEVGARVDRYEIVAPLRSGGMADLYLARHEGPGGFERVVALKVIHPRFAKRRDFLDMFLDEARLAARIDHPNVVHIENLGEHQGTYFMVMEYLHGASLGEVLAALGPIRRKLTPAAAVSMIVDLAAGLHAAHELRGDDGKRLGVVHRDISPQNALLTTHGEVKLIDFGIAKARGRLHVTQEQRVKGKVAYMPPEQVMGETLDRRTDIYALGVVLWELLTQRRLFAATNEMELIPLVRAGARYAPSQVTEGISPELDAVVMSALALAPEDRPPTARDFRQRLRDACPEAARVDPPDRAGLLLSLLGGTLAERATDLGTGAMATAFDTIELSTEPLRCLEVLTYSAGSLAPRSSQAPTVAATPAALDAAPHVPESPVGSTRRGLGARLIVMTLLFGALFVMGLLFFFGRAHTPAEAALPTAADVAAPAPSPPAPLKLPPMVATSPPKPDAGPPAHDASQDAPEDTGLSRPARHRRRRPTPFETFDDF